MASPTASPKAPVLPSNEAVITVKIRHLVFFFGLLLVLAQLAVDHGWGTSFVDEDEGNAVRSLRQQGGDAPVSGEELIDLKRQVESLKAELASVKGGDNNNQKGGGSSSEIQALRKELDTLKATFVGVGDKKSNNKEESNNNNPEQAESTQGWWPTASPALVTPWAKPPAKQEFGKPYKKVVVATKIHGKHQLFILKQMMCLFNFAYNNRMKYDMIIFTTVALEDEDVKHLQELGAPAKVSVVVDNPGLHTMIDALEPERKKKFLDRCQVNKTTDLDWHSKCLEPDGKPQMLAYNWQAEFRSLHLWNHPSMKNYRYMFWVDADAFCSEVWNRDPVAYFIENNLVMFFNNFGAGKSPGRVKEFRERFQAGFNKTITNVRVEEGHLKADEGVGPIYQIHGFMHITDLDWFRSEPVMHWMRTLIGDEFLVRRFCDQLAVTGASAVLAPERSWDMREHGIKLNVFHNGQFDGREYSRGHFRKYWQELGGKEKFPEAARETCEVTAAG